MIQSPDSTILLLRHGETAANTEGRYIGRTDLPLTERGRIQAARAADRAKRFAPALCLASPLGRTRETAKIFCSALNTRLSFDNRLREIDFGYWEGKTFAEIAAADPDAVERWNRTPEDFTFPAGESLPDFAERVEKAAANIMTIKGETVAVITHGGVFRHLLCKFLHLDMRRHLFAFDIRPGALAVVRMTDSFGVLSELLDRD